MCVVVVVVVLWCGVCVCVSGGGGGSPAANGRAGKVSSVAARAAGARYGTRLSLRYPKLCCDGAAAGKGAGGKQGTCGRVVQASALQYRTAGLAGHQCCPHARDGRAAAMPNPYKIAQPLTST